MSRPCCSRRAPSSSAARCRRRESLPLVCSLAATQLKLSPAEALAACTVNAAHVLGRSERLGRLASGYDADIVLLDAPDWRYLAYHLGGNLVANVVLQGQLAELG